MKTAPSISVSIVSYNTRELLRECLATVQARADEAAMEIIVADNASSDGSAEMVERDFPHVRLVRTGSNLGFGRAHNKALKNARGRHFLILNSDAMLEPGALGALKDFLDAHPAAGVAGAQLLWQDGTLQTSWGEDPQLRGVLWEQTFLDKILARLPHRSAAPPAESDEMPFSVEQLCGACVLIRREAWQQVGGFDPAFFMYVEDVDLCVRLRQAGWSLWMVPGAHVRHHLGASSERDWATRARMVVAYNQSRYYYFSRHQGMMRGHLLKAMTIGGAGLRLLVWSAQSLVRPQAREKVKLFRHVWRQTLAMTPATQHTAKAAGKAQQG